MGIEPNGTYAAASEGWIGPCHPGGCGVQNLNAEERGLHHLAPKNEDAIFAREAHGTHVCKSTVIQTNNTSFGGRVIRNSGDWHYSGHVCAFLNRYFQNLEWRAGAG